MEEVINMLRHREPFTTLDTIAWLQNEEDLETKRIRWMEEHQDLLSVLRMGNQDWRASRIRKSFTR